MGSPDAFPPLSFSGSQSLRLPVGCFPVILQASSAHTRFWEWDLEPGQVISLNCPSVSILPCSWTIVCVWVIILQKNEELPNQQSPWQGMSLKYVRINMLFGVAMAMIKMMKQLQTCICLLPSWQWDLYLQKWSTHQLWNLQIPIPIPTILLPTTYLLWVPGRLGTISCKGATKWEHTLDGLPVHPHIYA